MTQNTSAIQIRDDLARSSTVSSATIAAPGTPNNNGSNGGIAERDGDGNSSVISFIVYGLLGAMLLLLILILSAKRVVEAYRHPERHGSRNGLPGRQRQCRTKGLARAILETLPIVKFGDPEPVKPGSQDIELGNGTATANADAEISSEMTAAGTCNSDRSEPRSSSYRDATVEPSPIPDTHARSFHSGDEQTAGSGELGCPICTEDFTRGDDIRILPCNHRYHPACIDPWLLNVSGTCPLCRVDLRPVPSNQESPAEGEQRASPDTAAAGENADGLAPPLGEVEGDAASAHRRRLSRFAGLHFLRHPHPDERIEVLRRLRAEESQRRIDETAAVDHQEERRRRDVLARTFRVTFDIRTRTGTAEPGVAVVGGDGVATVGDTRRI